jgi:hypothetical protein
LPGGWKGRFHPFLISRDNPKNGRMTEVIAYNGFMKSKIHWFGSVEGQKYCYDR